MALQFNKYILQMKPSASMETMAKAKKLKAQDPEIIDLAGGEPDFDTPKKICDELFRQINAGFTHYTVGPGLPELRQRIADKLERENGCEPTLEEVAARAGLTPDEVVLALEAAAEVESLNKPVGEGDGASLVLGDRLMDQRDDTETLLNRMLAGQLLHLLKEEERRLIELRYFENLTQVQTAGALGMTQVQVSRAEKRILRKMRSEIV